MVLLPFSICRPEVPYFFSHYQGWDRRRRCFLCGRWWRWSICHCRRRFRVCHLCSNELYLFRESLQWTAISALSLISCGLDCFQHFTRDICCFQQFALTHGFYPASHSLIYWQMGRKECQPSSVFSRAYGKQLYFYQGWGGISMLVLLSKLCSSTMSCTTIATN